MPSSSTAHDYTFEFTTDLSSTAHEDSVLLRTEVFVNEQHVPKNREIDDDEDSCIYLVAYDLSAENNGATPARHIPCATLRLLPQEHGFHVQRVAVARDHRGTGLGRELMLHAFDYAIEHGVSHLGLDAQTHATGFYESLGFTYTNRPEFLDAGIAHREMFIDLALAEDRA